MSQDQKSLSSAKEQTNPSKSHMVKKRESNGNNVGEIRHRFKGFTTCLYRNIETLLHGCSESQQWFETFTTGSKKIVTLTLGSSNIPPCNEKPKIAKKNIDTSVLRTSQPKKETVKENCGMFEMKKKKISEMDKTVKSSQKVHEVNLKFPNNPELNVDKNPKKQSRPKKKCCNATADSMQETIDYVVRKYSTMSESSEPRVVLWDLTDTKLLHPGQRSVYLKDGIYEPNPKSRSTIATPIASCNTSPIASCSHRSTSKELEPKGTDESDSSKKLMYKDSSHSKDFKGHMSKLHKAGRKVPKDEKHVNIQNQKQLVNDHPSGIGFQNGEKVVNKTKSRVHERKSNKIKNKVVKGQIELDCDNSKQLIEECLPENSVPENKKIHLVPTKHRRHGNINKEMLLQQKYKSSKIRPLSDSAELISTEPSMEFIVKSKNVNDKCLDKRNIIETASKTGIDIPDILSPHITNENNTESHSNKRDDVSFRRPQCKTKTGRKSEKARNHTLHKHTHTTLNKVTRTNIVLSNSVENSESNHSSATPTRVLNQMIIKEPIIYPERLQHRSELNTRVIEFPSSYGSQDILQQQDCVAATRTNDSIMEFTLPGDITFPKMREDISITDFVSETNSLATSSSFNQDPNEFAKHTFDEEHPAEVFDVDIGCVSNSSMQRDILNIIVNELDLYSVDKSSKSMDMADIQPSEFTLDSNGLTIENEELEKFLSRQQSQLIPEHDKRDGTCNISKLPEYKFIDVSTLSDSSRDTMEENVDKLEIQRLNDKRTLKVYPPFQTNYCGKSVAGSEGVYNFINSPSEILYKPVANESFLNDESSAPLNSSRNKPLPKITGYEKLPKNTIKLQLIKTEPSVPKAHELNTISNSECKDKPEQRIDIRRDLDIIERSSASYTAKRRRIESASQSIEDIAAFGGGVSVKAERNFTPKLPMIYTDGENKNKAKITKTNPNINKVDHNKKIKSMYESSSTTMNVCERLSKAFNTWRTCPEIAALLQDDTVNNNVQNNTFNDKFAEFHNHEPKFPNPNRKGMNTSCTVEDGLENMFVFSNIFEGEPQELNRSEIGFGSEKPLEIRTFEDFESLLNPVTLNNNTNNNSTKQSELNKIWQTCNETISKSCIDKLQTETKGVPARERPQNVGTLPIIHNLTVDNVARFNNIPLNKNVPFDRTTEKFNDNTTKGEIEVPKRNIDNFESPDNTIELSSVGLRKVSEKIESTGQSNAGLSENSRKRKRKWLQGKEIISLRPKETKKTKLDRKHWYKNTQEFNNFPFPPSSVSECSTYTNSTSISISSVVRHMDKSTACKTQTMNSKSSQELDQEKISKNICNEDVRFSNLDCVSLHSNSASYDFSKCATVDHSSMNCDNSSVKPKQKILNNCTKKDQDVISNNDQSAITPILGPDSHEDDSYISDTDDPTQNPIATDLEEKSALCNFKNVTDMNGNWSSSSSSTSSSSSATTCSPRNENGTEESHQDINQALSTKIIKEPNTAQKILVKHTQDSTVKEHSACTTTLREDVEAGEKQNKAEDVHQLHHVDSSANEHSACATNRRGDVEAGQKQNNAGDVDPLDYEPDDCISLYAESVDTSYNHGAIHHDQPRLNQGSYNSYRTFGDHFDDYFKKNKEECVKDYETCLEIQTDIQFPASKNVSTEDKHSPNNECSDSIIQKPKRNIQSSTQETCLQYSAPIGSPVSFRIPQSTGTSSICTSNIKNRIGRKVIPGRTIDVEPIFRWHCFKKMKYGACTFNRNCRWNHDLSPRLQQLSLESQETISAVMDYAISKGYNYFVRFTYPKLLHDTDSASIIELYHKMYNAKLMNAELVSTTIAALSDSGLSLAMIVRNLATLLNENDNTIPEFILRSVGRRTPQGCYWETLRDLFLRVDPPSVCIEAVLQECIHTNKERSHIEDVYVNFICKLTANQMSEININLKIMFNTLLEEKNLLSKSFSKECVKRTVISRLDLSSPLDLNSNLSLGTAADSLDSRSVVVQGVASPDTTQFCDGNLNHPYENRQNCCKANLQEPFVTQSLIKSQKNSSTSTVNIDRCRIDRVASLSVDSSVRRPSSDIEIKSLTNDNTHSETGIPYILVPLDNVSQPNSVYRDHYWKFNLDMQSMKEGLRHQDYEYVLSILNKYADGDRDLFTGHCYNMLRKEILSSEYHMTNIIQLSVQTGVIVQLGEILCALGMYVMTDLADAGAWVLAYRLFKSLQPVGPQKTSAFTLLCAEICLANQRPLKALAMLKRSDMLYSSRSKWQVTNDQKDEYVRAMVIRLLLDVLCKESKAHAFSVFKFLAEDQRTVYYPIDLTSFANKIAIELLIGQYDDLLVEMGRLIMCRRFTLETAVYRSIVVNVLHNDIILAKQLFRYGTWLGVYPMFQLTPPLHVKIQSRWTEEELYLALAEFLEKLSVHVGHAIDHLKPNQFSIHLVFETIPKKQQLYHDEFGKDEYEAELRKTKLLVKSILRERFDPSIKTIVKAQGRFLKLQSPSLVEYLKSTYNTR